MLLAKEWFCVTILKQNLMFWNIFNSFQLFSQFKIKGNYRSIKKLKRSSTDFLKHNHLHVLFGHVIFTAASRSCFTCTVWIYTQNKQLAQTVCTNRLKSHFSCGKPILFIIFWRYLTCLGIFLGIFLCILKFIWLN